MAHDVTDAAFQAAYLREIEALFAKPRLQFSMDVAVMVAVVAQLKTALREPDNDGPTSGTARRFTRAMIEALVKVADGSPVVRRGLELGFHD